MKTPLEMAQLRFRIAVQKALSAGVGSAQLQTLLLEECVNEVDYPSGGNADPVESRGD